MLWKYNFKYIMITLMAEILLIETEKKSPIAEILRTLGHSIIRIYFAEGVAEPEKLEQIPDLILWDADIDFSPLRFLQTEHTQLAEVPVPEIVLLKTYDKEFLHSWLGGSHFGFLLRPVSESAVISVVENVLNRTQLHLSNSIPSNYLEQYTQNRNIAHGKLLDQRNFLSTVIDSLRSPFIVIDATNYQVILANAEAIRNSNGFNVHCYEMTHNRTSPCSGEQHACPLSHVVETGAPYSVEHQHQSPTGEPRFVEVRGYPIKDESGKVTHIIEHETDITSRYLYQEKLEAAKLAAEDANRAKSQFIANMSHELRTPLNIILGFSELLTQEETDPKKQEKLASVERAGKNLLAIINDILDFSQIESKHLKLEYEPFSLRSMLVHQKTFFDRQLQHKQIEFKTEIADDLPHHFCGDQRRVHQILTNLVSNAIKFTPRGSVVLKAEYRDERVVLQVIDTGIGIDLRQSDRLFRPFEQIDAADNRSYSGTGLGLAIVKSLVDEMEGTVNVDSTPGRGSIFTVSLPLKPVTPQFAQPGNRNEESSEVESESPLHILVAEDNKVNQQLMKMILKNLGYTCDVAPEGQTALAYLQKSRYDLAIIDMHMPIMDGYQLAREIRRDPQLSSLVIIALSAATGKIETDEFLAAGCNDFVHKPVDTTALDRKIKELI